MRQKAEEREKYLTYKIKCGKKAEERPKKILNLKNQKEQKIQLKKEE